jgi:uncharacterized tellurite resistance protein B-like protein
MMPRVTSSKLHEAHDIPLSERVDYLTIVASMAGADVSIAPEELEKLRELCKALDLPPRETEQVLATSRRPTAMIDRHFEALKASPLRFALLSDCLSLAYADGEYAESERKEIAALARALDVAGPQLAALEECALSINEASAHGHEGEWKKRGEKLASQLAAVGIPVGAVAALSAVGLSTAGVSTGAAALIMGLGLATGLGAVVGLSVGTVLGLRWLHDRVTHTH